MKPVGKISHEFTFYRYRVSIFYGCTTIIYQYNANSSKFAFVEYDNHQNVWFSQKNQSYIHTHNIIYMHSYVLACYNNVSLSNIFIPTRIDGVVELFVMSN